MFKSCKILSQWWTELGRSPIQLLLRSCEMNGILQPTENKNADRTRVMYYHRTLSHSLLRPGSVGEGGWWWSLLPVMRTGLIPSSLLLSVDKPAILVSQKNLYSCFPNPHPSWWCDGFLCSSLNLDSLRSLTTKQFTVGTPHPNEKDCAKQIVQQTLWDS